ncbi:hypothetical protein ALC53_07327 [Atta colombica]|uniref:Uncharacterized protein n=1 Tax=Atta colombica TaxID=520822 RepID=A0A195BDN7_9HYME|nr:hypothetical protein ALC53_07327 [Atta colombica]
MLLNELDPGRCAAKYGNRRDQRLSLGMTGHVRGINPRREKCTLETATCRIKFCIAFTATFYQCALAADIRRGARNGQHDRKMIDDRQLSPERSREEVHLPNRGHGRHGLRESNTAPFSSLKKEMPR